MPDAKCVMFEEIISARYTVQKMKLSRTIAKKAYRTSVPYFLAKIEAYHTILTYRRTVLPFLLLTTRNFN